MIKDTWDKNENASANKKEITVLKEHFPACFKEDGSFDIERFKEYLSEDINVINEGYELKFLGKNYARLLVTLETETVIVPNEEHNQKEENKDSENIYITGDNLDGLKHLLKSYAGKVKCIYIDPPYNTGSDGFVYNDNFNFTVEELTEKLSIGEEQAQRILDLTKRGSASHSAWLMFMYPRLQLARDLLSDDGVIFISIDDNELSNLKLLSDDIFGEEHFIAQITTLNNPRGRSQDKYFATNHEYILVYSKTELPNGALSIAKENNQIEKEYPEIDHKKRRYRLIELRNTHREFGKHNRPNLYYPIYYNKKEDLISLKEKKDFFPIFPNWNDGFEGCWTWDIKKAEKDLEHLQVKEVNGSWKVYRKDYGKGSMKMLKTIFNDKSFYTDKGQTAVSKLFNTKLKVFEFPKSVELIKQIIQTCCKENNNIVLDFFSGSGTAAHALLELNVEDKINRNFVMVQLPEEINKNSVGHKEGFSTIDEIGRERIIKAANKIKEENPDTNIDLGFKHFTLKEPVNETVNKLVEFNPDVNKLFADKTLLDEFGVPTVITTWLNNDGYGLTTEVEKITFAGYETYYKEKHLYLVHPELPNEAIEELVVKYETDGNFNPENIVLFGYSFTWTELESLKTNLKRLQDTEKNLRINFDVRY